MKKSYVNLGAGKFYINLNNGEVTYSRTIAMAWYRGGDRVEIWQNGRVILTLNM